MKTTFIFLAIFVVQYQFIQSYGAIHPLQDKSLNNKGAREFKKLNSFLICSADRLVLQRAPFFINFKFSQMQYRKRAANATRVEKGNTAHGIPYHVLYPTVGAVKATSAERTDRQRLFNQLEGWFFNNTGWALAQKLQKAFDALEREQPSAINQPARDFIALVLADGLRRYNQNTMLERAEIGGYVSEKGGLPC